MTDGRTDTLLLTACIINKSVRYKIHSVSISFHITSESIYWLMFTVTVIDHMYGRLYYGETAVWLSSSKSETAHECNTCRIPENGACSELNSAQVAELFSCINKTPDSLKSCVCSTKLAHTPETVNFKTAAGKFAAQSEVD